MSIRSSGAMPLALVEEHVPVVCVDIVGGHTVRHRLTGLGILPGTPLELLSAPPAGPVLVEVRGSRVAIGRGMAQKILVAPA